MSPWYLLGGVGLAAGVIWLLSRAGDKKSESAPKDTSGATPFLAGTEAETAKALTALGALPELWAKKASEALLSGNAAAMNDVADAMETAAADYAPGEPVGDALEGAAKILRGRALATKMLTKGSVGAAPYQAGCVPLSFGSPRDVLAADPRRDWTERFPFTASALAGFPEYRFEGQPGVRDDASAVLGGLYVIDGVTYFVGDPRTIPGSWQVDETAATPEGWSSDGALPGLYMPTVDDVLALQDTVRGVGASQAVGELEAVAAGMAGHFSSELLPTSVVPETNFLPEPSSFDQIAGWVERYNPEPAFVMGGV